MSFHGSAQNIRLDDGHILKAELANVDGEWVETEIDLNGVIGNANGNFEWGGQGTSYLSQDSFICRIISPSLLTLTSSLYDADFAGSAQNISFGLEGDDNAPILHAALVNEDGDAVDANINLSERLGNDNGSFSFGEHLLKILLPRSLLVVGGIE